MEEQFKKMAALVGDPTRASILWKLLDGKAFTATELSIAADTSPQNLSMHLNKLLEAGLLSVESQGRHRYFRFARKEVAYAIEAMTHLLPSPGNKAIPLPEVNIAIKNGRTCYDHLAGRWGVAVTESLQKQKIISFNHNQFELGKQGQRWFSGLGIDVEALKVQRRSFLRPCLDWSERKHHMAGSLAAALLNHMLAEDWIRRNRNSRAVTIAAKGEKKFYEYFKLDM